MKKNKQLTCDAPRIIVQMISTAAYLAGQCDACSPVVLSKPDDTPSYASCNIPYIQNPSLLQIPIEDSIYFSLYSPFNKNFTVLNKNAFTCLQYFNSSKTLEQLPTAWYQNWGKKTVRLMIEKMIDLELFVPEGYAIPKFTEFSDTVATWLHITDHCNLQCSYCYLPHYIANMSIETGNAAIEAIFQSADVHNYQTVKLKYAGGEPLLRFPFVVELHRYAQEVAKQHHLALDGVVLSNGTLLTKEMVQEMQALGLRLMISVDRFQTPGVLENSGSLVQRIYPDGRDAAADALRGIDLALECGLTPEITITVSGRNVGQLPELLAYVLARELPFSLNFYRENGCSVCHADLQLEEERFIEGMLAAYKVIEANLPKRSLLASLADMANLAAPHVRRCSVGHSYLVVDPFGRVAKCQMQMDKPVTDIHAADPLAVVRADQAGIQNLIVDEKEECRECQWKYWCAGGCPLETYRATGRYDVKSPHCAIYKALYPEVLRIEGLRLLKYAEETELE